MKCPNCAARFNVKEPGICKCGCDLAKYIAETYDPRTLKASNSKFIGAIVFLLSLVGLGALLLKAMSGMTWGRPLRVNGRILKPKLTSGEGWASGNRPTPTDLNQETKKALEVLWLHDAIKEYASVPVFSRLGWQLAALAAPPQLLRDVHIAAIQEIDHAQKCLALAAGFGNDASTVLPIPSMFEATPEITDPVRLLAVESLEDGCLLEAFNADVAEESALICRDPISLKVIQQITREERFHAELSWRILEFCIEKDFLNTAPALQNSWKKLLNSERPTASSSKNLSFISNADPLKLIEYGRLPDNKFDALWRSRLVETETRLYNLINSWGNRTSHVNPKLVEHLTDNLRSF